jgi:hypothetical protein
MDQPKGFSTHRAFRASEMNTWREAATAAAWKHLR